MVVVTLALKRLDKCGICSKRKIEMIFLGETWWPFFIFHYSSQFVHIDLPVC